MQNMLDNLLFAQDVPKNQNKEFGEISSFLLFSLLEVLSQVLQLH
jgi:hypothetical protein